MDNPLDRRTVAIELAYNYRKGQLQQKNERENDIYNDIENKCREWAEQNCMEFEDEAKRILTKLESPL
jgi:DNA anti-recombination protein RmuC